MQHLTRLLGGPGARADGSLETFLLSLCLAFVLGQLVAWVYQRTHSGLSYSRTFTQSLVLLTMIATLVMFVIGDSLFTAFGLIGALAIIRFRNVLKDTRDTAFVFTALVLGMAIGAQRYAVALVGIPAVLLVTLLMRLTAFGARASRDVHLTCALSAEGLDQAGFSTVLARFCRRSREISVRSRPTGREVVFAVDLRDRRRHGELVDELQRVAGVAEVVLIPAQESLEP